MIGNLGTYDSLIIILYFLITLIIFFVINIDKEYSSKDYFLAGRNVGWIVVGISLFVTNISSEHLVGLAGSGASRGLAVGNFEWMAILGILLLGWIFIPLFYKSGVFTIPQFIGKRFDKRSKYYLAILSIVAYIFTKISVSLFAGGLLLKELMGWDLFTSSVFMILITGIYTVVGGMYSVVYTQVYQSIVLTIGSVLLTSFGLYEVGGFSGLVAKLPADYFHIFKPSSDPDFPWTGILFGAPILAVWYWCTDQFIVQRILTAKDIKNARRGTLLAAGMKILPVFIFVLPGLISYVLFPQIEGDEAFAYLLNSNILPVGIKGFVVAGLFAAIMSSLSSVFNSTATLFTIDFYKERNPDASDYKLVLVGRLATLGTVIVAILWVPLISVLSSNMYVYLQSVQSYISPPIAAIFLVGLFWKKANATGAFYTLVSGGVVGISRIIIEMFGGGLVTNVPLLNFLISINYLHFAIFLFLLCTLVLVVVSTVTSEEKSQFDWSSKFGFSPSTVFDFQKCYLVNRNEVNRGEVVVSVLLVLSAIVFWSILF